MIRYKNAAFLSFSAKRFDCSSSPTYKKYLPHWTEHTQSIVKVKNKVCCPGGNLFSNSGGPNGSTQWSVLVKNKQTYIPNITT